MNEFPRFLSAGQEGEEEGPREAAGGGAAAGGAAEAEGAARGRHRRQEAGARAPRPDPLQRGGPLREEARRRLLRHLQRGPREPGERLSRNFVTDSALLEHDNNNSYTFT